MDIYQFLFKIFHKITHTPKLKISYYVTAFKFKGQGVQCDSFFSTGVPFLNINHKSGNLTIGNNFRMNNGLYGNQIGFSNPCIFVADEGFIKIGNNVGMSQATLIAKKGDIVIGNNTLLGGGVRIYTTDFHSLNYQDRRIRDLDMKNASHGNVTIGDDCFIGSGSVILKGVRLGNRVIVGANSVVTSDFEDDCIVVGSPARKIKGI